MVLFGQGDGTEIAALFFEVRRQMADAVSLRQAFPDFIDPLGVLMRTDGERGGEVICVEPGGFPGSLLHAQGITVVTALFPFRGRGPAV